MASCLNWPLVNDPVVLNFMHLCNRTSGSSGNAPPMTTGSDLLPPLEKRSSASSWFINKYLVQRRWCKIMMTMTFGKRMENVDSIFMFVIAVFRSEIWGWKAWGPGWPSFMDERLSRMNVVVVFIPPDWKARGGQSPDSRALLRGGGGGGRRTSCPLHRWTCRRFWEVGVDELPRLRSFFVVFRICKFGSTESSSSSSLSSS